MNNRHYTINNRTYSSFQEDSVNMERLAGKNYLFELPYLSTASVTGERAAEFLQGQLSCDVREVNEKSMRKGALCNLKGRVQALIDVINWQGFKLVLPADLTDDTLASLSKTALVSRVSLHKNPDVSVYGFYMNNPADLLPFNLSPPEEPGMVNANEVFCIYSLSNQFYLVLVISDKAQTLVEPFQQHQQLAGSLEWHELQLQQLNIQIYPQTRGLFLPHRMDLHKRDFISFDKGCYKGQEIIARTHYRAKLKHGLRKFIITTQEALSAGMKLFSITDNAEMGELIDFCPLNDNRFLIVTSILNEHPEQVLFEGHANPVTLTINE